MSSEPEEIPADIEAEMAVLGSMLLSPAALADCLEILQADDFARPAHKEIFAAIAAKSSRGEPADAITVKAELERAGALQRTGGAGYLHSLIARVPAPSSAGWYALRVREHAIRWRLAEGGAGIRDAALRPGADLEDRIDAAYRILDEAAGKAVPPRARPVAELVGPVIDALEQSPGEAGGITTGWADLDELIPGLHAGELITIGARPGVGKSVVMLNIAAHAALHLEVPVLVASLEMSEQECVERLLAAGGTVDLRRIRSRNLDDGDWERLAKAHARLTATGSFMINADPYLTVQSIRSDLRAMRRTGNPAGLVVVDYLQLMTSGKKAESRQAEVSAMSRGLKLLAKEFAVPVIVGSQLNRGPEMRSDHRPLLADLRESGSVEQDSDIVILLYREDAYERESEHAGEIDLILSKHRQGPQSTVTLAFQGHYAKCSDMYRPWTPSSAALEGAA